MKLDFLRRAWLKNKETFKEKNEQPPNNTVTDLCSCANPIECESEWDWDRCETCGKLIHEQD